MLKPDPSVVKYKTLKKAAERGGSGSGGGESVESGKDV